MSLCYCRAKDENYYNDWACKYCNNKHIGPGRFICTGPPAKLVTVGDVYGLAFDCLLSQIPSGWEYESFRMPKEGDTVLSAKNKQPYESRYINPRGLRIILKRQSKKIIFEEDENGPLHMVDGTDELVKCFSGKRCRVTRTHYRLVRDPGSQK